METDTIICPHCGHAEPDVYVNAPAEISYAVMVGAEVSVADDLVVKDYGGVKGRTYGPPARYLPYFCLDETHEQLAELDHGTLELDSDDLTAYCMNCNGDVTEQFRTLLDARVGVGGAA